MTDTPAATGEDETGGPATGVDTVGDAGEASPPSRRSGTWSWVSVAPPSIEAVKRTVAGTLRPIAAGSPERRTTITAAPFGRESCCLLYTSDAADDLLCVDLGGR